MTAPSPDELLGAMPFARSQGMELLSVDAAEVVGRLDWHPDRTTAGGGLHGGALMALADTVGAVCAFLNLPPSTGTSTTSSSTVFLRGVRSGSVTAVARPLHAGRSTIAVSTELRDGEGNLVAQVTQSQAVLRTGS